jgi:hypothetical protein
MTQVKYSTTYTRPALQSINNELVLNKTKGASALATMYNTI